jgi:fimbrial chaperone protein
MKNRKALRIRLMSALCVLGLGMAALPVMASSFRLQSTTLIMEEREGRTSFNVTNTGEEPILLLTQVEDLGDEQMAKNVLVTPAVTRIDPGQSQIVNFSLEQGMKLDREYMLKASFEGVTQRAQTGTRMPVRQQIGFILQPKALTPTPEPWNGLVAKVDGNQLTLNNPSKHVVRMGPVVKLLPSGKELSLSNAYVLPGQSVSVTDDSVETAQQFSITPLSRYGLALTPTSMPIER